MYDPRIIEVATDGTITLFHLCTNISVPSSLPFLHSFALYYTNALHCETFERDLYLVRAYQKKNNKKK